MAPEQEQPIEQEIAPQPAVNAAVNDIQQQMLQVLQAMQTTVLATATEETTAKVMGDVADATKEPQIMQRLYARMNPTTVTHMGSAIMTQSIATVVLRDIAPKQP